MAVPRRAEEVLPEIEALGFEKVTMFKIGDTHPSFNIGIQARRGVQRKPIHSQLGTCFH